jgi:hypothetical protein
MLLRQSNSSVYVPVIGDPVLFNDWHVLARSSEVNLREVRPARLLGEDLVAWRSKEGLCAWEISVFMGLETFRGPRRERVPGLPVPWLAIRCIRAMCPNPRAPFAAAATTCARQRLHVAERNGLV